MSSDALFSANLDAVCESLARRSSQYETALNDIHAKLSGDLSNSRAIDTTLREAIQGLHHNKRKAKSAMEYTVPQTMRSLEEDHRELTALSDRLPKIEQQAKDIRDIYDRGRVKANDLIATLEWLNTPIPLRLRTIIFTPNAPVSTRWIAIIRLLFALTFLTCAWIAYIALWGAIRAHRNRLVWGDKLMQ